MSRLRPGGARSRQFCSGRPLQTAQRRFPAGPLLPVGPLFWTVARGVSPDGALLYWDSRERSVLCDAWLTGSFMCGSGRSSSGGGSRAVSRADGTSGTFEPRVGTAERRGRGNGAEQLVDRRDHPRLSRLAAAATGIADAIVPTLSGDNPKIIVATPADVTSILQLRLLLFQIGALNDRLQRITEVVSEVKCAGKPQQRRHQSLRRG